ncbi:hypothetical protein TNCV_3026231 [Trichonephila clavipes]|nr:hypothetical protein TNCV_3026231 [Trichonephila clavipes]
MISVTAYSDVPQATVAEWPRYRIVAGLVTSSSPVPLKTRRVGQRGMLNLLRAQTFFRWCGRDPQWRNGEYYGTPAKSALGLQALICTWRQSGLGHLESLATCDAWVTGVYVTLLETTLEILNFALDI